MEDQTPLFEYLEVYQLLICTTCHYAIVNLDRHLQEQHHILKAQLRRIVAAHSHYEIASPSQIIYPHTPIAPIACLESPKTCYLCQAPRCRYLSPSQDKTRQRANTTHGCKASKGWLGFPEFLSKTPETILGDTHSRVGPQIAVVNCGSRHR